MPFKYSQSSDNENEETGDIIVDMDKKLKGINNLINKSKELKYEIIDANQEYEQKLSKMKN